MSGEARRPFAVADSSPLIALSVIGHLGLLERLYGRVAVPPAVWEEATQRGLDRPGAEGLLRAQWIDVVALRTPEAADALLAFMDRGESEALCLVRELGAELFVVDDRRPTRYARRSGIRTVGAVGVLAHAKRLGLVDDLEPLFEALAAAGFYMTDRLKDHARAVAEGASSE